MSLRNKDPKTAGALHMTSYWEASLSGNYSTFMVETPS